MAPNDALKRARKPARAPRGPHILAALISGATLDEIAALEKLPPSKAEKLLRDELRRRWVAPGQDYGRLQIARLETILKKLIACAERGEFAAIDRILRILDRLDKYHGFGKTAPQPRVYDDEARRKLIEKLDRAAARRPASAADGS